MKYPFFEKRPKQLPCTRSFLSFNKKQLFLLFILFRTNGVGAFELPTSPNGLVRDTSFTHLISTTHEYTSSRVPHIGRTKSKIRNTSVFRNTYQYTKRKSETRLEMTSMSGVDQLPEILQAVVFVGIYGSLCLSLLPLNNSLNKITKSVVGMERWRSLFVDTSIPLTVGLLYLISGLGHFVAMESFISIYPPIGTWGIWYLPGSASFHVIWTGIVELLGGLGLIVGATKRIFATDEDDNLLEEQGLITFDKMCIPTSAATLFLLTLIVTPANIYMYTHGAMMGGEEGPPLPTSFHVIRFIIQSLLLSFLLTLAKDSFFFSWGDELD